MKEGYIVWNLTSWGDGYEIFGVYRTREKAQRIREKIKKCRYGDMTEEEINDYERSNGDCLMISYFKDTNGKTYSVKEDC